MTGITDEGIEIDREFIAPPSAVFAAWTTPESFAQWFGGRDVVVPIDSLHFHAELGRVADVPQRRRGDRRGLIPSAVFTADRERSRDGAALR